MTKPFARRLLRGFGLLLIIALLGIVALIASLFWEHSSTIALPTPTGTYPVGRTIAAWQDEALDRLAPTSGTKRELLAWIWYPAATASNAPRDDYLPATLRVEIERSRGWLISNVLTRDLSLVQAHSLRDPAISDRQRAYPVVIMRAGASAEVANYSTLAEDLASHGYIVVGFDAPYRTNVVVFPDGRVAHRAPENDPERCLEAAGEERARCADRLLAAWTADTALVLDRLATLNAEDAKGPFAKRLDLTRVGMFGHSFGGAATAQFCHDDSRCKAGIDIDGAPHGRVIADGLDRPFMFLLSDHGVASDPESRQIEANIQSIYDRLPRDRRVRLVIRGANHFTFSDDGALLKSHLLRRLLGTFGGLKIDGRRQLIVAAYAVRSFFDACLRNPATSRMTIASPLYPEIEPLD